MRKECLDGDRIFVIHDFLPADECDSFIARSEKAGFELASFTTPTGPTINRGIRDNARLMADDVELAASLWRRIRLYVPGVTGWHILGLNERFRFYRYDPGEKFALHRDGCFRRHDGQQSQLTFMMYLNDEFTGGETKFYREDLTSHVTVKPKRGMALVFTHVQLHEGAPVLEGRKYVLRTDVMYSLSAEPAH
jgi:hypothetical protein